MTDQENKALYIAEECRKAGMTLAGAAGVIANVEAESAFKSNNVQDAFERIVGNDTAYTAKVDNGSYQNFAGDSAGYGLAQWTAPDRKAKMLAYFRERGKSIGDFKTQVDFLIYEMRNYTRAWSIVTTSNNPYECGYAVCMYYEIPADTERQAQYRGGAAQKWYNWLSFNADMQSSIPNSAATGSEAEQVGTSGESSAVPTVESWPPRTVDSHCEGWPEVWLLQALLKCRGYGVLVNGIWSGDLTEKVREFQTANGLAADGVVGKKTWTALGLNPAVF